MLVIAYDPFYWGEHAGKSIYSVIKWNKISRGQWFPNIHLAVRRKFLTDEPLFMTAKIVIFAICSFCGLDTCGCQWYLISMCCVFLVIFLNLASTSGWRWRFWRFFVDKSGFFSDLQIRLVQLEESSFMGFIICGSATCLVVLANITSPQFTAVVSGFCFKRSSCLTPYVPKWNLMKHLRFVGNILHLYVFFYEYFLFMMRLQACRPWLCSAWCR